MARLCAVLGALWRVALGIGHLLPSFFPLPCLFVLREISVRGVHQVEPGERLRLRCVPLAAWGGWVAASKGDSSRKRSVGSTTHLVVGGTPWHYSSATAHLGHGATCGACAE